MGEAVYKSLKPPKLREKTMTYKKDSPPDRILRAGRKLFFDIGFQRVSTDMIVKEAAVSKASLYKYFPSMVELLKAVTVAEAVHFLPGEPKEAATLDELRAELIDFGAKLMRFLNRSEIFKFGQLMHEEARAHPEIAAEFYAAAHAQAIKYISVLMDQGLSKGYLDNRLSAEEMAMQLVGMWEGVPMVRAQLGVSKKPFPRPQDWAEKCVLTLLPETPART